MNAIEPPLHVLLLEAYPGPSHQRVNRLLQRHSRHRFDVIEAPRDHWKQLALLAHIDLADRVLLRYAEDVPDVLIFSGAMNVPGFLSLLPATFGDLPRIVYFHESQWSYPTLDEDTRPYLVQHLDAVMAASEVWFNSGFHRETFWSASARPGVDSRIRDLARRIHRSVRTREHVVYPPVALDTVVTGSPPTSSDTNVVWNARWELDKRPDRLIDAVQNLMPAPVLTILGTGGKDPGEIADQLAAAGLHAHIPGNLADRGSYEAEFLGRGTIVSTADHEFFGIGVLEAVLAGNIPVLPDNLAYPETLPSAWLYRHADTGHLARTLEHAMRHGPSLQRMHLSDARRFLPEHTVPVWDAGISRVWRHQRADR